VPKFGWPPKGRHRRVGALKSRVGSYRRRFRAFGGEAASSLLRVVLGLAWGVLVKKNLERFQNSRCWFQVTSLDRRLRFFFRWGLVCVLGGLLGCVGRLGRVYEGL
jgi:hypothetical protein